MKRIRKVEIDENFDYWKMKSEDEQLPPMKQRCHDCAITTGFYTQYAEELMKQPPDIIEKCVKTWWCHNHGNRSCKGIAEYVESNCDQHNHHNTSTQHR
jgi:hypothetical protein